MALIWKYAEIVYTRSKSRQIAFKFSSESWPLIYALSKYT